MNSENQIQNVEMRTYYNVPIHCPFCGANPEGELRNGGAIAPCKHTLFLGHSELWFYIADRFEEKVRAAGISVERDEGQVLLFEPDDESWSIDEIINLARFQDAVMFTQIVGTPVLESTFIGFAPIEEDEQ